MLKHNNSKLNIIQITIYFIEAMVFFPIILVRENFISLFSTLRNKRSINNINRLIKIKNSPSQVEFIENDNFDEKEIKNNRKIEPEIVKLYNKLSNISKIESIIYELSTFPTFGSLLKFILKVPYFNKLNASILDIVDCHLKLGELLFENNLCELSIKYLSEASQTYREDPYIYYLIGTNYFFEAKNIINPRPYYDFVLNIIKSLKYADALIYLKKALKLKQNDEKILQRLGDVYYNLEYFVLAKKYYEEITKLNSNNIYANEKLGIIYEKLNLAIKSIECKHKIVILEQKCEENKINKVTFPNNYKIGIENEADNFFYCLAIANNIYSEDMDKSIQSFQKALCIALDEIDQNIYNACAYKNINLTKIANTYIELAINIFENIIIVIKRSEYENLNKLQEKYFPVNLFQKRIDIIFNYYDKQTGGFNGNYSYNDY